MIDYNELIILCATKAPDGDEPELVFKPMPLYKALAQFVVSKGQFESANCRFIYFINLNGEVVLEKRI